MSACTDADVRVLRGTYLTLPPGMTEQARWAVALDAVAPAIAARALRDLSAEANNRRLPVLDGGSSHIDLIDRAGEIETNA